MAAESPNASDKHSKMNVCCSIHSYEECTFVCGDCTELICDSCVGTKNHEDHDIKSIKKFIKEVDLEELMESGKKFNCLKIKDETEKRFQKVIDGIHSQASKMISEINKIKKKKIRECEERKDKNATTVNEVLAVVSPTEITDKIDNLPKKGGRMQYAEVAQALLKYRKTTELKEVETKYGASIYVPTLTCGRIQKSRLEKLFGDLNFEKEDVDYLFDSDEEGTEIESSDKEGTEIESSDDESESNDDESKSSDDESESNDDESKSSDDESESSVHESESSDNENESSDHESESSDD